MDNYPNTQRKIVIYPSQNCSNCHGKRKYDMIMTNDGNRKQKCLTCNWTWTAPSENQTDQPKSFFNIFS